MPPPTKANMAGIGDFLNRNPPDERRTGTGKELMRRMRRFELRRIAELERKIPHRVAPTDPEEACRLYAAMRAREGRASKHAA